MAQPPFVLNFRWRKPARLFQAAKLKVEHPEIRKMRSHSLGGFRFSSSTGTGRIDTTKLDVSSPEVTGCVFRIHATAEGVKSVLRRLRPQEAAVLDDLDGEIDKLQVQLAALKEQRKEALRAAWQRGNVVRLKELETLLLPSGSR